jgi:hypothetical protein
MPNVASGTPKPPEKQPNDLRRNLQYAFVGVSVTLASGYRRSLGAGSELDQPLKDQGKPEK